MLDELTPADIQTEETSIFVRWGGSGPPVLLLHGFPETHVMWRGVAPLLAHSFTVVCADLRGYGLSGCPASAPDHAPYAKRAMAHDLVTVMERLGFRRFAVAGHDRGGRVAYGSAPMRGSLWRIGRGRCSLSRNHFRNASSPRRPTPSWMRPSGVGVLPRRSFLRQCVQPTRMRFEIRPTHMRSRRSIERAPRSTESTTRRIVRADLGYGALS